MNFLREILAFERRMRQHPLPMSAQLLWYKLMDLDNRLFWQEWITLDNDKLAELLGSSNKTARIARDQLVEAGYLQYQRGAKKRPNKYKLSSVLALDALAVTAGQPEPQGIEEYGEIDDPKRYFGYTDALGQELTKTTEEIISRFWPQHEPDKNDECRVFYYIRDTREDEDGQTVMTFPKEKKALLVYAFEQASMAGKNSWSYITGIYRNFHERGINTVDDAYEWEANHKRTANV